MSRPSSRAGLQGCRVAALLLAVGLAAGCDQSTVVESAYLEQPRIELPLRPIVVVSVDTLRADRCSVYGYFRQTTPFLERLATEGVLFENTFTTMSTTLPAHTSLWTSLYPLETQIVANGKKYNAEVGPQVRFFAEMLGDLGYTNAAFVSATPVKHRTGIGRGFDYYDEPDSSQRPANETLDNALAWLEQNQQELFFLWIHLFDPHKPYQAPPPYDEKFTVDRPFVDYLRDHHFVGAESEEVQQINNQYDAEVRFVDDQLQRLYAQLLKGGNYKDSTFVFLSDHGEGLGQHGHIDHGRVYDELLRIPFLLKLPAAAGFRGIRESRPVSLVDVVPTLVEELGLEVDRGDREQFSGVNALGDRVRRFAFSQRTVTKRFGAERRYGLVGRRWKYLLSTTDEDMLYDLERDPFERRTVLSRERRRAAQMQEQLVSLIERYSKNSVELGVEDERSEQTLDELRALGYLN